MTSLPAELHEQDFAAVAARLCNRRVAGLSHVLGGGNNRIYRADFADGGRAALKVYARHPGDARDRLGSEYGAVTFLAEHAPGWAPEPYGVDRVRGLAAYAWIDGTRIETCTLADCDRAIEFAGHLDALSRRRGAGALPPASEPILSGSAALAQVQRRLMRLEALIADEADLGDFLSCELRPVLAQALQRAQTVYAAAGLSFDTDIPIEQRTLSPSDFGFHNAIRRADGEIVFIDFEYFGWDDPAKLVADFVQHPGMQLARGHRRHVADGLASVYARDTTFTARLSALAPLIGLRWCLIMLNEFLPDVWRRRVLAGRASDHQLAKRTQLSKARAKLAAVRAAIEEDKPWS